MVTLQTYEAIQSWIHQQLAYEATHIDNAPLTEAQRKLLEKLELTLPPTMAPQPDPVVGDTNWIGVLLESRVPRLRIPNSTSGVEFVESQAPAVRGMLRWHCHVKLEEHAMPFPGPSGGLFPDGTLPSFSRKKDAKQYAAKCAVEWLKEKGYIPQTNANGVQSVSPQPQVQARPPAQATPPASPPGQRKSPRSELKRMASAFDNDEVSDIQKVARLCELYNFPEPRYIITKSTEGKDFFDGYPDLGVLAKSLPRDIGRVKNVFGKKATKEKIAQLLLGPLTDIASKREDENRRFLNSLPPLIKAEPSPEPSSAPSDQVPDLLIL
ncbi:hypothetical protein GGS23DRAFT_589487 [Durotheca rogersii]|uniref:uncharacterized protein n=1 Tax=Durotheca rogersii TaxID=419775 RepID=UPI00221E9E8C|nr:uncharacterized protein GGS23DRAFT_589487 [Durotheca rogersii]KAI5855590.1 hypothetical protein GGS23DRAFT_589487 [Durotheca rogersii]